MKSQLKRTIAILLALCFLVSLTATAVSALVSKGTGSFAADTTEGPAPFTVKFSDLTNDPNGVVAWNWNFGDGTTSDKQNPTKTYKSGGVYTVKLTVTNGIGKTYTIVQKNLIKVVGITCDFKTTSPRSGLATLTVDFKDLSNSAAGITHREWDFDNDGNVDSYLKNPSWDYNTPGTYTVTLNVEDADGNTGTETKVDYIDVQ
jgi:PKD repeat protein